MELDRQAQLRTPAAEETGGSGAGPLRPAFPVNAVSELVADVIEQTGLLSPADVTLARSAGKTGSFPQALVFETGGSADASKEIPHVLERIVAIPYAIDGGILRNAIADPQNANGVDELKLATRLPIELAVASKEDILHEVKRLARAAEAFGARAMLEVDDEELVPEEEGDDLEAEDGISDARSSASSTRSSSRPPRREPPTCTSSRSRTRWSSGSAWTASCTRSSGCRSGGPPA